MTPRPRLPLHALVIIFFLVMFSAKSVQADFRASYKKGIDAVEGGRWADAAAAMRAAIAEQPREGERIKLYGMRYEDYLPHYYLGVALFNTGDCEGAMSEWLVSEEQGPIRKTGAYKTLLKDRQVCQPKLATKVPTIPTPPPVDGKTIARDIPSAGEAKKGEEAAHSTAKLSSGPDLGGETANLPKKLGGDEPTPAPSVPTPELLAAAQAYFSGQYQRATDALSRLSYNGRIAAQVALLRAASRYALFVLSAEKDERLREQAQADVQLCKRLDPSCAPDPRAFSPRFTRFFAARR